MDTKNLPQIVSNPKELEDCKTRLTEIRFEALVKMYDFGQIEPRSPLPFVRRSPLPPQWFKIENKFTLEFIKTSDEFSIGKAVKQMFSKLQEAIEQYEKQTV